VNLLKCPNCSKNVVELWHLLTGFHFFRAFRRKCQHCSTRVQINYKSIVEFIGLYAIFGITFVLFGSVTLQKYEILFGAFGAVIALLILNFLDRSFFVLSQDSS